jgi:hypothetical protein
VAEPVHEISIDPGSALPDDEGPLAGLQWPGTSPEARTLIHDDGTHLSQVNLDGERKILWEHPAAGSYAIAASSGGEKIAFVVYIGGRRSEDVSAVLYELTSDGRVRTIDVVRDFSTIATPIYLRPPSDWESAEKLYWVRLNDESEGAWAESEVMVLDGDRVRAVSVQLRDGELPFAIHGFPGAATFSLTLQRQNNVPTRLEILRNMDFVNPGLVLTQWRYFESRAQTEIFTGVAWLSPTQYVIPVGHEFYFEKRSLRLFKIGCEYFGSSKVEGGWKVDRGNDISWDLLPVGAHRVLVLMAEEVSALVQGERDQVPWHVLDVRDGTTRASPFRWQEGPWSWVAPITNVDPQARERRCEQRAFTWP